MKKSLGQGGYLVLEFAIVAVIITMVFLAVTTIFISSLSGYRRESLSGESNRSAVLAIEYMARDLRAAVQVMQSYGSDSTTNSSIVMKLPSYGGSGIIANSFDYITYKLDANGNLLRTTVPGAGLRQSESNRVLATGVASPNLTYVCWSEFQGNGMNTIFTLPATWINTPSISVNGMPMTTGFTLCQTTHAITFNTPPAVSAYIEVTYQVAPTDAPTLSQVIQVSVQVNTSSASGPYSRAASLTATAMLRNKRS